MTTAGRILCEVLGCRRTAAAAKWPPNTRIVCGKCWRLANADYRRLWSRLRRRIGRLSDDVLEHAAELRHLRWRATWAFDMIIAQANEAKAGLG